MIDTAIVCSGQGAQSGAMFDLLAKTPAAEQVFQAAKRVLGDDPREVAKRSTDEALHADKLGQILCCSLSMAAWAVIGDTVPRPVLVAGYSVGELAAWGVAGVLGMEDVLSLAAARADAMDAATLEPSGLAAVRGLSREKLEPVCVAHGCYVAIVNAPDQMLVGGTRAALLGFVRDAVAAGAEHVSTLPVAVASHTPLLAAASEAFGRTLAAATLLPLPSGIRLLSGIDGATVFDVGDGAAKLARQIRQTVDWAACMDTCRAAGVMKVIELGPGSSLARMFRDAIPGVDAHALSEFHSLAGFIHWVGKPDPGA